MEGWQVIVLAPQDPDAVDDAFVEDAAGYPGLRPPVSISLGHAIKTVRMNSAPVGYATSRGYAPSP